MLSLLSVLQTFILFSILFSLQFQVRVDHISQVGRCSLPAVVADLPVRLEVHHEGGEGPLGLVDGGHVEGSVTPVTLLVDHSRGGAG